MSAAPFTVHLLDDEQDVTRGLSWLLDSVGIASRAYNAADDFLRGYQDAAGPACLVVDLRMPDMGGLELLESIGARGWDLPVIFLSAHGDVPAAVRAMQLGAIDFVQKPFNPDAFLASINKAQRLALKRYAQRLQQTDLKRQLELLSNREREVLKYLLEGSSSKEIGRLLDISNKTVDVHRSNIMKKMAVASYAELVAKLGRAPSATAA